MGRTSTFGCDDGQMVLRHIRRAVQQQLRGLKEVVVPPSSLETPLSQVFYVSRCALTDIRQVRDLHITSQRNNERLGLTGILLYTGGHFAQLLEGSEETMRQMMWRISEDSRHTAMRKLFTKPVATHSMASWSMRLVEAHVTDRLVGQLVDAAQPSIGTATELLSLMRQLSARGHSLQA